MKIITVTTSYANNFGALLQCYALSKFLNNQPGVECEVLDFYPPRWNVSWTIVHKPKSFRHFLKMVYQLVRFDTILRRKRKNRMMWNFRNNHIPLTKERYNRNNIYNAYPKADAYICGSDQIWNLKLRTEPTFFLDFAKNEKNSKCLSYAASIADPWTKEQGKSILPMLNRFDAIAIREKGNLPMLENLVPEKKPTVVCDPVFLLNKEEWDAIARKPQINEPYILCYFLSVSDFAIQTVKKIRELSGYKVVHLNINALDKFNSDQCISVADPCDFVGLIKNATLVVTNSFHCSAFSTIYHKDFCFVPKNMANERLVNLCEAKGVDAIMSKEKLAKLKESDLKLDYTGGVERFKEFINYSKNYLLSTIQK